MTDFKNGDIVFVPHAYSTIFSPHMTVIESVENGVYYCRLCVMNMSARRIENRLFAFKPNEVFSDKDACRKYIDNYYYDGLCAGCQHKDASGHILRCDGCAYYELQEKGVGRDFFCCSKRHCRVGETYRLPHEACSEYQPKKKNSLTWQEYERALKACDFNPVCEHHRFSVHKTVSYDRYLAEKVSVEIDPFDALIDGKEYKIAGIIVERKAWICGSYIQPDGYCVSGIIFEEEKRKKKWRSRLIFGGNTLIRRDNERKTTG